MVHLEDLDFVTGTERASGLRHQSEENVHTDAHVRREDDGDLSRAGRNLRAPGRRKARGPNDQRQLARGADLRVPLRGSGRGEVDDHVGASLERRFE